MTNTTTTVTELKINRLNKTQFEEQTSITSNEISLVDPEFDGSKVLITDSSGDIAESDITSAELSYLDGVTSNVQTQLDAKLTSSDIINNVTSTSTDKALSANMGKELQDQITNLQSIGRFLALWNSTTGLPESNPTTSPYTYETGDYFIVGTVGSTNYKPTGTSYTTGVASTVVETEDVSVGNTYYYDGTTWTLQAGGSGGTITDVQVNGATVVTSGVANIPITSDSTLGAVKIDNSTIQLNNNNQITAKTIDGLTATTTELNVLSGLTATTAELNATDGVTSNIQTQLDGKQETLVSGTSIKTINGTSLLGSGNISVSSFTAGTYILSASSWVNNTYTLTVQGMTSTSIVWIAPSPSSDGSNEQAYADAGIRGTSQSTNTLIFSCTTTPTSDININLIIG